MCSKCCFVPYRVLNFVKHLADYTCCIFNICMYSNSFLQQQQYNFINDFRKNVEEYEKERDEAARSVSR